MEEYDRLESEIAQLQQEIV